jgi:hypothetical protein
VPPQDAPPPSSTETIQQIEDGNLLLQGAQGQAQVPAAPAVQNLIIVENFIIPPPPENNNLVGENPQPQNQPIMVEGDQEGIEIFPGVFIIEEGGIEEPIVGNHPVEVQGVIAENIEEHHEEAPVENLPYP